MNTKLKLGIIAALVLVACITIWWGVRDASWWAVATLVAVGFIGGLAVGANNSARVESLTDKIRERYNKLDN